MFKHFKKDFPASIIVFLVAVPLCLGIAVASEAPALSGIIAGIIGGIQAFLTPQINNFDGSFFEYFSYHFSHGGIIFLPIFMYLYLNYELTKFSWLRVVLYLNMVLAFVMPLNFQIDSNYMYLAYPPNVNNPLILGEWPYYILYWEFIIVIFTYTTYVISTRKSL